jgi:hypothetical protein
MPFLNYLDFPFSSCAGILQTIFDLPLFLIFLSLIFLNAIFLNSVFNTFPLSRYHASRKALNSN